MKLRINLDEELIKRICGVTGQKKRAPAIRTALTAYLQMEKKRSLIARVMAGETDYSTSNEELERRSATSGIEQVG